MSFLFASVKKDLRRWSQDRVAMLIWFGIPFLIGGLITSMMDGGGGGLSGKLLIADEDDTLVSGFVVGAFGQEQLGDIFVVESVTIEDGERRINNGEASAFLTIPQGFQDALLDETPVTLTLRTNPAQTILPGIIEDVTEILLDAGFYLQRLFGPEIRKIKGSNLDGKAADVFTAAISLEIKNKFDTIGEKLDPLAIELEIVEPPPAEPQPNYALLFLPGIVLMAVLFAANSLGADYWVERDKGTLRRLASAPGAWTGFLAGKAVAVMAMMVFVSSVTLAIGFAYHGVAWSKFVPSVVWVSLGGVALFAWFGAIQMLLPNNKAANLVTMILLFPLMMVGGSFFPFEALPDWVADMGRIAPNGYVVDRMSDVLTQATDWAIDLQSWLTLLAVAVGGLVISAVRLRTGFARR
ncbi:MAG: ABC transporter permease [Gammaproteobacteria bacterium]|nr:ABC transporter permease [Gammaproteobacteria bacterium]